MKSPYPEVTIGSLASNEPGAFKIGPFGSSLKKGELVSNGIPVVGIENVLPNNFNPVYRKFITPEKFEQLSQYKMEPFDVVVTTMGTVGRSAVVPENIDTAIIDSHLFRMRLNRNKVDPAYLCYALNGYAPLMNQLKEKAVGAIMAGLNTKILRECMIPLPPLTEQQRIAAQLNEQMTAVSQARQAAEAQLCAARELTSAYLRDTVKSLAQKGFPRRPLGEFVLSYRNGFGRRPDGSENDGVIVLRLADVTGGTINLKNPRRGRLTDAELKTYQITDGDLLFVRVNGSKDLVGRCAIVRGLQEPVAYNDHLIRVRLNDAVLPEFVKLAAETQETRDYIVEKASTSAGQLTINQEMINGLELPIPPVDEQHRFIQHFAETTTASENLINILEAQLAEINQLPSALLRRAFAGER